MSDKILISGRSIYDDAWEVNPFGQERLFLRLPGWLDENIRDAARREDISAQDYIRYLSAAATGGPQEGYLDRWRSRVRQISDGTRS